jgi:valyl-tRNA synthetase
MESMHDWAISRQIVWGIRIPAWYKIDSTPNLHITFIDKKGKPIKGLIKDLIKKHSFEEIEKGLQNLIAPKTADYKVSEKKPGKRYLQETDTFDTWFSSGQWPLTTLKYPDSKDFKYFYPTDVLETGWEIVTRWVSRMIMFGMYLTGKSPFKDVYLHGHVRAIDGRKMSKSLGNVINPDDYLEKYGADALRVGLISGTANGKDFNFPEDKVIAYRNFANKIWNMARFMLIMIDEYENKSGKQVDYYSKNMRKILKSEDEKILKSLSKTIKSVEANLDKYRFADAAESIYHFMWHDIADKYIEGVKDRKDKHVALSVLRYVYISCLKLLHPSMPFVTEAIWGEIKNHRKHPTQLLINSPWPKS